MSGKLELTSPRRIPSGNANGHPNVSLIDYRSVVDDRMTTKLKAGVDKGRTVTSVADSVKKFGGAGSANSPEPSRVSKPKPATKKPELKGSASPALEGRATAAAKTSGVAKAAPAAKKPVASDKPRVSVNKKVPKVEEPVPTSTDKTVTAKKEEVMDNTQTSSDSPEATDSNQNAQNVISLFEQKATPIEADTPPWKRHLKNREKGKDGEEKPPTSPIKESKEKKSPIKTAEHKSPAITVEQKFPVKTVEQKFHVKTVEQKSPVKTVEQKSPVKTVEQKSPIKQAKKSLVEPDSAVPAPVNGLAEDSPAITKEEEVSQVAVRSLSPSRSASSIPQASSTNTITLRDKKLKKNTSTSNATDDQKNNNMSSDPKRASWLPKREECIVCNRAVFAMERLEADQVVYHKTCFKCCVCNKTLSTGTYAALQGKTYCKVHFKQLFKIKGNYDEGFGREQHKTKWVKKEDGTDSDILAE